MLSPRRFLGAGVHGIVVLRYAANVCLRRPASSPAFFLELELFLGSGCLFMEIFCRYRSSIWV